MACGAIAPSRAAAQSKPMRLGGPIFVKSDDPAVLAKAHRDLGYRAAYAPEVSLTDQDRINATIKEFAAQDVAIAEVGAWVNMLDPDPEKRRKNMDYVTQRLALAEALARAAALISPGPTIRRSGMGPIPRISARSSWTPRRRTPAS